MSIQSLFYIIHINYVLSCFHLFIYLVQSYKRSRSLTLKTLITSIFYIFLSTYTFLLNLLGRKICLNVSHHISYSKYFLFYIFCQFLNAWRGDKTFLNSINFIKLFIDFQVLQIFLRGCSYIG